MNTSRRSGKQLPLLHGEMSKASEVKKTALSNSSSTNPGALAKRFEQLKRLNKLVDIAIVEDRPEADHLLERQGQLYEEVCKLFADELDSVGYVLLHCESLDDKIAFVRDDFKGNVKEGFVKYSVSEVKVIGEITPLIHEAKKQGARVVREEKHASDTA